MPQIERSALEKKITLRQARKILDSFCNDRVTYPDEDVILKRGICKVLAEEYAPLVHLAEAYCCVRSLRLYADSNPGPDGEIRFWHRFPLKVQIVCAMESYSRGLMREQLSQGEIVFAQQSRHRDKVTQNVKSEGRILAAPAGDIDVRVNRILEKVKSKEKKFYPGTDFLLIQEESAEFRYLKGHLDRAVCAAIQKNSKSSYKRIFILYGNKLKRLK